MSSLYGFSAATMHALVKSLVLARFRLTCDEPARLCRISTGAVRQKKSACFNCGEYYFLDVLFRLHVRTPAGFFLRVQAVHRVFVWFFIFPNRLVLVLGFFFEYTDGGFDGFAIRIEDFF